MSFLGSTFSLWTLVEGKPSKVKLVATVCLIIVMVNMNATLGEVSPFVIIYQNNYSINEGANLK